MSAFYDAIDEVMGDADDLTDIVATIRRCWLFDFRDDPIRLWHGHGRMFSADGHQWLGTQDSGGRDLLKAPSLQDGRDGTSAAYQFSLNIPSLPGEESALELYEQLKAQQSKTFGRRVVCYLVLFKEGEGLRPMTPISFYKELYMQSPKFSEKIERGSDGLIVKNYSVTIVAKDDNSGRSQIPGRTYADTMQKRRASELDVAVDKGSEYLALLANRTYKIP